MKRTLLSALFILTLICSLKTAPAATIVWDGGPTGTDNIFTTPANWVGDALPTTLDDAVFDNSVVGTPSTLEVNGDITVGGIQFLSNVTTPTVTIGNGSASPVTLSLSTGTPNPLIAVSNTTGNVIVQDNVGSGSGSFQINFVSGSFKTEGASTLTVNSVITSSGAQNLTKTGTGTLILNRANTWTPGTLNLREGTVKLGIENALPTGSLVTNSAATAGTLDLAGFNQQALSLATNAAGGSVTIGNSSTSSDSILTVGATSGTYNFAGLIKDTLGSGTMKVALAKPAAQTLNLYGANTYSGGTTLTAGGIGLGVDSVFSGGAVVSGPLGKGDVTLNTTLTTFTALNAPRVIHNNFILNVAMTIAGTQPLTFTNGTYQLTAGRNMTINNTTTSTVFADDLTDIGAAVTLTKPGAGRLIMMVKQPSTFLGNITASAGMIAAGNGSPFPTNNNNQITFNGATLDLNGFNVTLSRLGGNATGSVLLGTNTLTAGNNVSSSEFAGVMSGTGGYVKVGTVSQTLSGTNTFSGGITIKEGPIYFSTNGLTPNTIALGAGTNTITISSLGTNTGSIGAARGTSIVTNNVVLANVGPTALFDPANSGTLFILAGQVSGSGGFLRSDKGSGTGVIITGDNTFTGGVLMTSRSLMLGHKNALGTGALTIGDPTTPPPGNRFLEVASTVDLTGANAITNPTTVNQSFSLNTTNLGSPIDFGLELSGPMTLSSGTKTIGSSGIGLVKISGVISGSGGINKGGPNTLTLSANNTYTGSTIVSNGPLALIGSGSVAASSDITMLTGATLDVSGRADGTLTVAAPQTLGGSGTIIGSASGGLTMSGGGTYRWQLSAEKDNIDGTPGIDFDQLNLTAGNLVLGGSSKLLIQFANTVPSYTNAFWQANHTWKIISLSGGASNPGNLNFSAISGNPGASAGTFSTSADGSGNIILSFVASLPPQPVIEKTITDAGTTNATIRWSAVNGASYEVQYKDNVDDLMWNILGSVTATSSTASITDPTDPVPAQRFYRIVVQ